MLLCLGEINDQLFRLDLDPHDMSVDKQPVFDWVPYFEMFPNRLDDQLLDLGCRHSMRRPCPFSLTIMNG